MHGGLAVNEIAGLVIAIGAIAIIGLIAGFFGDNAMRSAAQPKPDEESDAEQGAFDDPHSEEWTR